MNNHIIFVTTNTGKFDEVKRWISELEPSITLEQASIDLPEYQTLDVKEVALGKAQEAWKLIKKPLLIDDGGIYLEHYHQFPGTLSKYVFKGIGLDGIWLLAQHDPRAYFLSCLVYMDEPTNYHFFEGICKGTIIQPPGTITHPQLPYTEIFVPEGSSKPFAQLRGTSEEKSCHHRLKAIKSFLTWFKK